jgi:hypothetical protein
MTHVSSSLPTVLHRGDPHRGTDLLLKKGEVSQRKKFDPKRMDLVLLLKKLFLILPWKWAAPSETIASRDRGKIQKNQK